MSPSKLSGKVQTVLGPIEPDDLGVTLTHEHLLIDLRRYFTDPAEASRRADVHAPLAMDMIGRMGTAWAYNLDNLALLSVDDAVREVSSFRRAGGNAVVDTTNGDKGRDPLALARISRATGLHVIMGAGHYVPLFHPSDIDSRTEESITETIVRDVTVGVWDTGIRSGVIGEIGNLWPLGDNERKILRASARAQMETGAPISIHPGAHNDSPAQIMGILTEMGVDPRRVIMGHLDFAIDDFGPLKELADTGCFLEYDIFGVEQSDVFYVDDYLRLLTDVQRLESIEFLIEQGHHDQVVVAQDVCQKRQQVAYGGKGYAHILENIVPRMRKRGFAEDHVKAILADNPRRALTFK